jgi:AcrR family transcriptional regulator
MPRLSDDERDRRRRHVLVSAWKCFSRQGFQATSMDQIIAETGMSSAAVYRYFPGKDDLIAAAADEALVRLRAALSGVDAADPPPTPATLLALLVDAVTTQMADPDYDMTRITIATWGEALRQPGLAERARHFYAEAREMLTALARRWHDAGLLAADADPAAVAALFLTLMPGIIVTHHLAEPAAAAELWSAITGLTGA